MLHGLQALVFFIVYNFVAVRHWPIFTARCYASAVYAVVVCLVTLICRSVVAVPAYGLQTVPERGVVTSRDPL